MASPCHPWFTTTNLSYRFPIFETSATALCGTTGNDCYWLFFQTHIQGSMTICWYHNAYSWLHKSKLCTFVSCWNSACHCLSLSSNMVFCSLIKTSVGIHSSRRARGMMSTGSGTWLAVIVEGFQGESWVGHSNDPVAPGLLTSIQERGLPDWWLE